MELMKKKATMMKLALMLFLVSFTVTVDARFDGTSFITQVLSNDVKSTTTACCDSCPCTKSIPPQCRCNDIGETCHSACESCFCTKTFPPKCHCLDITDFCYEPCNY
ncbi:unnamed protein product [Lathyrus oleraceus]